MTEWTAPPWAEPIAGFRSRKAAQMCAYFALKCDGMIEKLKLIKLVYLAEREFLSRYHHPMLFDELYSLPHGPICSSTLNGIDGIIHEQLWDDYIARNGNLVVAIKALDRAAFDEISDAEMEVISDTWKNFGSMTASQLRNYSHDHCPEYTETERARIPISYKQLLEAIGESDAAEIARDIDGMIKMEGFLAGK